MTVVYVCIFQEHGISSIEAYNYKHDLSWSSNHSDVDESQLFRLITHEVEEIIRSVKIRTFIVNKDTNETSVSLDLHGPNVVEQRHRNFGRCYSIYPSAENRDLGIYYIRTRV